MWHCIHWTPVGGTQWSSCDPVLCFVTVARIVETWRVKTCVKIEYKQHEDINVEMFRIDSCPHENISVSFHE